MFKVKELGVICVVVSFRVILSHHTTQVLNQPGGVTEGGKHIFGRGGMVWLPQQHSQGGGGG
jgi:hypothetical protein